MSDGSDIDFLGQVQGSVVGDHATVTMIFQNGERRSVQILKLLGPIDEHRIRAEDWKSLHVEFQRITLKLVQVRGAVSDQNLDFALIRFEDHWTHDCRDLIQRFAELERLPARATKQEFILANEKGGWLAQLLSHAVALDQIVSRCIDAEALRAHLADILATLLRLERVGSQLLDFLDSRLQRVIKELDQAVANARELLTHTAEETPPRPAL
jgi:hypothetical protein